MRRTKDVPIKMCRILELLDNFRDKNPFLVSIIPNFAPGNLFIIRFWRRILSLLTVKKCLTHR